MPGFFLTEQNRFLLTDRETGGADRARQEDHGAHADGRFGTPEDLTGALLWLLSPAAAFVTGVVLPVDGGVHRLLRGLTDDRPWGERDQARRGAVRALCSEEIAGWGLRGKRVLAIVPDHTRTRADRSDVPRARRCGARSGRHGVRRPDRAGDAPADERGGDQPAPGHDGRGARREVRPHARSSTTTGTTPTRWRRSGRSAEAEVARDLGGPDARAECDVTINKLALEYDLLLIIGPTFPHEVVGFSGGNKYLFPGIGGPEILDMFHWLGALITNPTIIGTKYTPVRAVVDRAAALVPVERKCVCLVVEGGALAGLYIGAPEEAWSAAAELSNQIHIVYKDHAYHTVLSCAPPMYDELWVGGKCMYKLEPVVADGGELIIYAPHIHEISVVHGALIRRDRLPRARLLPEADGSGSRDVPARRASRTRRTSRASARTRTASRRRASR